MDSRQLKHGCNLGPLYTRAQVDSSNLDVLGSSILGGAKLSSKAQTTRSIESLTNFQALKSLSKFKVTLLRVKYQRGNDTKQKKSLYGKLNELS